MASHMNCTSTSFTAYGGSGGGIYHGYNPGNEYEDVCKIENGTYPNPMIVSHGVADNVVFFEWQILNLYHWQLLNSCRGYLHGLLTTHGLVILEVELLGPNLRMI